MPKGQEASLLAGLVDLLASPRRSTGRKGATRHRLNYDSLEIELLYRMWQSEENAARLARLLERTKDAIEYVWRWCDGANFPPEAGNDIIRKVREVERRLGRRLRGQWSTLPAPLAELLRKASREAHPGG